MKIKEDDPHGYKDKVQANIKGKRAQLKDKLGHMFQRILISYWRNQDGYYDEFEKLLDKTDYRHQQQIVELLKENKLKMADEIT